MSEIQNPQLSRFCNESLRVFADRLAYLDMVNASVAAQYNAENLGGIIDTAGAGSLITDGSETDGRPRVAGGDVYNLITLLSDFKAFMDANNGGRRDVLAKWKISSINK